MTHYLPVNEDHDQLMKLHSQEQFRLLVNPYPSNNQ